MTVDISGLKDIHMPVEPSFWPPAPGWILVGVGVFSVLSCVAIVWYWHRFGSKGYAKRLLKKAYQSSPEGQAFALQVSLLFKRIVLVKFPREEVAALSDTAWAQFILRVGKHSIPEKMAHFIAHAAYLPPRKSVDFSNEKLYNAANEWIDVVFKGKPNARKQK